MNHMGAQERQLLGTTAALLGAALWGFSGACAQISLGSFDVSPLFITLVRAWIAAVLLIGFSLIRYRRQMAALLSSPRDQWLLLVFGVGLFASQLTYVQSVSLTNAGTATVLQSLATVLVMAFACVRTRRLPYAPEAAGLACALASTWLIATHGDPAALAMPVEGIVWGLANALAVALYIICPRPLYDRYPAIPVAALGLGASAVLSLGCWMAQGALGGSTPMPSLDARGWVMLAGGIGVLGTACAFGLYLFGVAVVGSVKGSLFGAAEPVSAMLLTALWIGASISASEWAGLVLMVAMIVLISWNGRTPARTESALPLPSQADEDQRSSAREGRSLPLNDTEEPPCSR